jgi:hypothetical protein
MQVLRVFITRKPSLLKGFVLHFFLSTFSATTFSMTVAYYYSRCILGCIQTYVAILVLSDRVEHRPFWLPVCWPLFLSVVILSLESFSVEDDFETQKLIRHRDSSSSPKTFSTYAKSNVKMHEMTSFVRYAF